MNRVFVEYDGGIDAALENKIYEHCSYGFTQHNKIKCDSGCCMFPPYTRDLVFTYETAQEAIKAAEKLKETSGLRIRTELDS